jgi:hypothetical protein
MAVDAEPAIGHFVGWGKSRSRVLGIRTVRFDEMTMQSRLTSVAATADG